ncbi:protein CUSTOS [Lepisosteus oculatus]|uniref:protein CUSTOS n=1 Tax=Lepisosteus oculatus TaxID=7918 RepID=UPI0035F51EC5
MASPSAARSELDSSSEEDEERFREAAWTFETNGTTVRKPGGGAGEQRSGVPVEQASRRVKIDAHEHDGNVLQTTPEFRAHVAKKLGALLDSCITEAKSSEPWTDRTTPDAEDGFRLFSTSVPGLPSAPTEASRPAASQHPCASSSESDSELESRVREAAVSPGDLLRCSVCPSMPQDREEGEASLGKRKKKRKKKLRPKGNEGASEEEEERTEVLHPVRPERERRRRVEGERGEEQTPHGSTPPPGSRDGSTRKKKKKKRRRRGDEEALLAD